MIRCRVIQYGDYTRCDTCGLEWDTNETYPPECRLTISQPPKRFGIRLLFIFSIFALAQGAYLLFNPKGFISSAVVMLLVASTLGAVYVTFRKG